MPSTPPDKRTVEVSKWGRHWVLHLRVTPQDGTFPEGYVIRHQRIQGGKRGLPAVREACEAQGLEYVQKD